MTESISPDVYKVPGTTRQLAGTANIVVHHVLELQHGRRDQRVRVGDAIFLPGDHRRFIQRLHLSKKAARTPLPVDVPRRYPLRVPAHRRLSPN